MSKREEKEQKQKKDGRQFLPTVAELIDRLSIHQLKEWRIREHGDQYAKEMKALRHDIALLLEGCRDKIDGDFIHATIIVALSNAIIWDCEAAARRGEPQDLEKLRVSHTVNGVRNRAGNLILEIVGEADRRDRKTDALASDLSDYEPSLLRERSGTCER